MVEGVTETGIEIFADKFLNLIQLDREAEKEETENLMSLYSLKVSYPLILTPHRN
jgi:hypothetical protein